MAKVNEPPEIERLPASPITYGRWAQRADRQAGRRDGRKRIPSLAEVNALVESDAPAQLPTPYLQMLFSRARDMMEHERLWFHAASATDRAEQAELQSQAVAARKALEPAEAVRAKAREQAKVELTEADLQARHPAEELRSDVFIRLRREAEREGRIANAEDRYLRILADIQGIEDRLARANAAVHNRLSIAQMRALRISAYFSARTATYWEGLVLAHRDGKHLAPLLPHLTPHLPAWVVPEEPLEPPPQPQPAPEAAAEPEPRPAVSKQDTPVADRPAEQTGGAHAIVAQEPAAQDPNQPVPAHRP
jgi:hypothetical protein